MALKRNAAYNIQYVLKRIQTITECREMFTVTCQLVLLRTCHSKHGVSLNLSKVEAVKYYSTPSNVKELKSFLGLVGYYRRFIQNYGKFAKPLNLLFREGVRPSGE